jgi:hypothetical protein
MITLVITLAILAIIALIALSAIYVFAARVLRAMRDILRLVNRIQSSTENLLTKLEARDTSHKIRHLAYGTFVTALVSAATKIAAAVLVPLVLELADVPVVTPGAASHFEDTRDKKREDD